MFRGSEKGTGYPFHSPVSPSLPLPCVTLGHHISTGVYRHTLIIFNWYCCFSTATMVTWTHHKVTLYVHCLSCFMTTGVLKPFYFNACTHPKGVDCLFPGVQWPGMELSTHLHLVQKLVTYGYLPLPCHSHQHHIYLYGVHISNFTCHWHCVTLRC
jgi:hypothetical protein